MTSLIAQGIQSRHFKKGCMLLRPRPWPSCQDHLQTAHLRGSQVGWLFCLRTFLKRWVLESSKVKKEMKQSFSKEKIKTLGVWRGDCSMSDDKKRERKQTEAPGVTAESICTRSPLTPDQGNRRKTEGVRLKKSARSMREAERGQQDTLMWDEGTQRDRKVAAKETSKPLSLCQLKWLSLESTGPESSNWQLAYKQHT